MSGLYIHIPYCRSKCAYCDFYSGPLTAFDASRFTQALMRELRARRAEVGPEPFSTIYFGGGTPSSVPPALLKEFCLMAAPDAEITIEANPDDVTPQWVDSIRAIGINRVSMGVQSLIDSELQAVGRRHTAAQAISAVSTLRAGGISNISLDLIYGLPGQTLSSWSESLTGTLSLKPTHLSAYILSYEPGTRLHTMLTAGKIAETPDDDIAQMYTLLCQSTAEAGMIHYEISNFSLPNFHSRHNTSYWDQTPYLGIGPAAHSFDGTTRRANPPSLSRWMKSPESAFEAETPDADSAFNDQLLTSLRTDRGINPALFTSAELRLAHRLLTPNIRGYMRISEPDWLIADAIIRRFIR